MARIRPRWLSVERGEWLTATRRLWRRSWLLVPLLALPALWPLYSAGLMQGLDVPNHLMRLVAFDQQIRAGNLFPRWMPDLALGYGYPLFNYYAPAMYYLAELFRLAGLSYAQALGGLLTVLVWAAGLGMWRLAADFFPARSGHDRAGLALVAAVAYMYSPYLLTNTYVRGAIAELGAQALLPWVLWSFRRLLLHSEPARYLWPAVVSLGGLAVTHNLSLVMVAPLLLGYAIVVWWRSERALARAAWLGAAVLAAAGLCAFYWWPLLGERAYLTDNIDRVARLWLPTNLWTWPHFLDAGLLFGFSMQSPFQLGLVQIALGVIGLALARRWWNGEWLFLAAVALGAAVAIGRWWEPLWLGIRPLLIFQFPWRLLMLINLVLALFAAGTLLRARPGPWRAVLITLLVGFIIVTQRPRLKGVVPLLPADLQPLGAATVAQFEWQTDSLGATTNYLGTTSDFMPRWVDLSYGLASPPAAEDELAALPSTVAVRSAGEQALELATTASQPATLRLATFYFPGWHVQLDGRQTLSAYPSTKLGLLTIDVPSGQHTLRVEWNGTALQQWSAAISLLTLVVLAGFALQVTGTRAIAGLTLAAALAGTLVTLQPMFAPLAPVSAPVQPFATAGLGLAGYRYRQTSAHELELRPYWWVQQTPPDLEFQWRLVDTSGQLVAETSTRPFFDTLPSSSWRAGTLVDDAYRLALPEGRASGTYQLEVCAAPAVNHDADCLPQRIGAVQLARGVAVRGQEAPVTPVAARYADRLELAGFAVADDQPVPARNINGLRITAPGATLEYTLYWRPFKRLPLNYHAFVQLIDVQFNVLARQDDILGPFYFPARLWGVGEQLADTYRLAIPAVAPSGVYWPSVGLYDFISGDRLGVEAPSGASLGSELRLPPIKVLSPPTSRPQHQVSARFEDLFQLQGYSLNLPTKGLHAGSSLTATLYFLSAGNAATDYTRFVHLWAPAAGLVAQADGPPQSSSNPTSAWIEGEVVADTAVLTVDPGASPGQYFLQIGLYDPAAGGSRLPVYDQAGTALPDGQLTLTELTIEP